MRSARALGGDTRAQAMGIARFFLALGSGAIVVYIVTKVTTPLLDTAAERGSGQVATTGTDYLRQAVDFMPVAVLLVSFFGVVAAAVFAREVLR